MAVLYTAVRLLIVLWLVRMIWEMARLMLDEFE